MTRKAAAADDGVDEWLCCHDMLQEEQRSKYDEDDVRVGVSDNYLSQLQKDLEEEEDVEEEDVDLLLDSTIIDCLGIHFDCSALKHSSLVRQYVKAATRSDITWFQDMLPDTIKGQSTCSSGLLNNNSSSSDEDDWALLRRTMKTIQAPLRVTLKLCHQIRLLPERDVTLYIRLDEEVPKDSCTAYEVDWEKFCKLQEKYEKECHDYYNNKDQQQKQPVVTASDNIFRCFRLCSREKRSFSRTECIVGTFASACLHPYTLILSGTTITTKRQRRLTMDKQDGPPTTEAPFRPKRLLLDRPEDVCTAELQFYLTRMGLTEVQQAPVELKELYEATDLDFFLDDPDVTANDDDEELQLNDYDELVVEDELPFFLAGNTVDERQNEMLGQVLDEGYSLDGMLETSVPFICLD